MQRGKPLLLKLWTNFKDWSINNRMTNYFYHEQLACLAMELTSFIKLGTIDSWN
jgi:hypothetical protein